MLFQGAMVRALLRTDNPKTQTRRIGSCQLATATELGVKYMGHATKGETAVATYRAFPGKGTARWGLCECPYGIPGQRLWVKETFSIFGMEAKPEQERPVFYRADDDSREGFMTPPDLKWKPSIFMPRWASRITLEITAIRAERVQDISEADAKAEGIETIADPFKAGDIYWKNYTYEWKLPRGPEDGVIMGFKNPINSYRSLWNSINLKPKPLYERDADGKKQIKSYVCFPWSEADFDAAYPDVRTRGIYRGKPLAIIANPWVWAITFKKL